MWTNWQKPESVLKKKMRCIKFPETLRYKWINPILARKPDLVLIKENNLLTRGFCCQLDTFKVYQGKSKREFLIIWKDISIRI